MNSNRVQRLTVSALLIAIGIAIPIVSPVKIVLEPASFTLGSHVAIFIGMFISPAIAVAVALGTTAGFLLSGFPIVVTLRALSHIVFAGAGAYWLKKHPDILHSPLKAQGFSFVIALLHAAAEVIVVSAFYFGGSVGTSYYAQGFIQSVFLLVGVGTVAHSMVDFIIAQIIWKALNARSSFSEKILELKK